MRAHAHRARQLQVAAEHVVDFADMFSVGADDVHVFADGTGVDHVQTSFKRRTGVASASGQSHARRHVPASDSVIAQSGDGTSWRSTRPIFANEITRFWLMALGLSGVDVYIPFMADVVNLKRARKAKKR